MKLLAVAVPVLCHVGFGADVLEVRIGSGPLRAHASAAPLPEYPARLAAAGRQGRVTAQIVVEPDGALGDVEIVEFTDASMGAAVRTALRGWKFRPIKTLADRETVRATGRLTFSFRIQDGQAIVIDEAAVANAAQAAKAAAK